MSIYFHSSHWISWSFTAMTYSFLIKDRNFYRLSWNWENVNLSKALTALQPALTPLSAWETLLTSLCCLWDHWQLLLVQSGCAVRIIISPTMLIQGNWDSAVVGQKKEIIRQANLNLYVQQIMRRINSEMKFPSLRLCFLWVRDIRWKIKWLLEFIVSYIIKPIKTVIN